MNYSNNIYPIEFFSIISLDVPYGLVVCPTSFDSFIGILFGDPYTVADELKINLITSCRNISSSNARVPTTLLS